MARRSNIRQRGQSWVVYFRQNGKQVWKSFRTRDEAELYLAKSRAQLVRGEFRRPARVKFSEAADEWVRHGETEGGARGPWKPSTRRDYRSALNAHLRPAFGELYLEKLTAQAIAGWRSRAMADGLSHRNAAKLLAILHGIFERARKAYGFPSNPVVDVDRVKVNYSGRVDFYSPEEVWALVRGARSDQDGALFLTAAFTGLRRGELLALRWRDVDFQGEAIRVEENLAGGEIGTPKSGKVRSLPMVPEVATALARLSQRGRFAGDDDVVFPGVEGGHLDGSALRRRYLTARKAAKLRPLKFHELRHTFGSLAIDRASIVQVQHWMGHADIDTTMRYLHHKSRAGEAELLAGAFEVAETASALQAEALQEGAGAFREPAPGDGVFVSATAIRRNGTERVNAA
jgi:integrase